MDPFKNVLQETVKTTFPSFRRLGPEFLRAHPLRVHPNNPNTRDPGRGQRLGVGEVLLGREIPVCFTPGSLYFVCVYPGLGLEALLWSSNHMGNF